MRPPISWVAFFVALLGVTALGAQRRGFELSFPKPTRINAVKAWGDRICALDFDDYQLRCFDARGKIKLERDIRDPLEGRIGSGTHIIDYTILDDGSVAIVGDWLGPVSQVEPNLSAYLLILDNRGNRMALHDLGDLAPQALGGSRREDLEVLGFGVEFVLACDPSLAASSRNAKSAGALIHPIGPAGETLSGPPFFGTPSTPDNLSHLGNALSKGMAIDSAGNRYFWVDDGEFVVARSNGEQRNVILPPKPGLFRTPLRVLARHGGGAFAVFLEGENKASPQETELGFFELVDPERRVYAIDPTGQAEELPIPGSPQLVGELADGTLVGLRGAGRGRGIWEVFFMDPIAQLAGGGSSRP